MSREDKNYEYILELREVNLKLYGKMIVLLLFQLATIVALFILAIDLDKSNNRIEEHIRAHQEQSNK